MTNLEWLKSLEEDHKCYLNHVAALKDACAPGIRLANQTVTDCYDLSCDQCELSCMNSRFKDSNFSCLEKYSIWLSEERKV